RHRDGRLPPHPDVAVPLARGVHAPRFCGPSRRRARLAHRPRDLAAIRARSVLGLFQHRPEPQGGRVRRRPDHLGPFCLSLRRKSCPRSYGAMRTVILLTISNVFMTFAWYGHLKFREYPLWIVIAVSWLIALPEYCFQVPANRIGITEFSAAQLKVMQEV